MQVDQNCVFCKIVGGEIPSYKVREDDKSIAFLDINPSVPGQTLVIPREHYPYAFGMPEADFSKLTTPSHKLAKALELATGKKRICLVIEGFDVPHVHVKLYPAETVEEFRAPARKASPGDLAAMQEKIKRAISGL